MQVLLLQDRKYKLFSKITLLCQSNTTFGDSPHGLNIWQDLLIRDSDYKRLWWSFICLFIFMLYRCSTQYFIIDGTLFYKAEMIFRKMTSLKRVCGKLILHISSKQDNSPKPTRQQPTGRRQVVDRTTRRRLLVDGRLVDTKNSTGIIQKFS